MPYGLKEIELAKLSKVFASNEHIKRVILYGSRAKGNYKLFSDVDITLEGPELTLTDLNHLSLAIDDLLLPYQFDISIFHTLKNHDLIDHIQRIGITIFERESEWKEYKLGELTIDGKGSYGIAAPAVDYDANKYTYLRITDINDDGTLNKNGLKSVDDKNASKYLLQQNDIVFARTGASVGRSYFYDGRDGELVYAGFLIKYSIDPLKVNPKILKFYTHSQAYYDWITAVDNGATRGNINAQTFASMPVSLPERKVQDKIVFILSSLDDKIDLLHRENATLEQMAETLFRQWFVVEAKEEWEEGKLTDYIKLIGGGTPKTAEESYWNGNVCWLSGGDIANNHKGFVSDSEKHISEIGLNNSAAKLLPENALVVSARGTVGKYCLLSKPMAFSQSNYGILPTFEDCYFFTYLLVAHNIDELQSAAYGSVFDTITTKTFDGVIVTLPQDKEEIVSFEKIVSPYFEKIKKNQKQIQTLIQTRDGLLPRLMSGEVNLLKG